MFPPALRAMVIVALVASATSACGGSSKPTPVTASNPPVDDSPVGRCLAIAGAKRERKADEPAKITAKHVLVKYAGAKRAPATVTRTREEACRRAEEARSKLEGGMPFADVVAAYSEEPGAVSREGSLGAVERAHLVPAFADAAFELQAGEVSHVVETDFGFHVILRTQ